MDRSSWSRGLVMIVAGCGFWIGSQLSSEAMVVTQLELTGGIVEFEGRFSKKLDRLLDQEGVLVMGQYQPTPDIFPSTSKKHRTFSLFTSGVQGAAPPSAAIHGTEITVDLSSLFFGVSRGDRLRAWNIGGNATGVFDPETTAFSISWEHLFRDRPFLQPATFTLQGTAVIPLPGGVILFTSGLTGLAWLLRRHQRSRIPSRNVG